MTEPTAPHAAAPHAAGAHAAPHSDPQDAGAALLFPVPGDFPIADTFVEQFARIAATTPDRPAIISSDCSLTFAELEERTNRAARLFAQLGVNLGDFVLISTQDTTLLLEATIAALKLGAIPLPVNERLTQHELDGLSELSEPALTVDTTQRSVKGKRISSLADAADLDATPLPPVAGPSIKAPTSGGSTGTPKIIVSTAPGVPQSYVQLGAAMRVPAEGVCVITAALYHNASFSNAMAGLVLGSTVVLMDRFEAETALELIDRHRATWIYTVPTMMLRIWKLDADIKQRYDLSSLETLLHIAAPCPAWLKREWIDWVGPEVVYEVFGTTEGQSASAITGAEWLERPGSVGRVISGEMAIRDENGAEAAPGVVGEVWVRRGGEDTPNSYRYLGAVAETAADGWETVGDMGCKDDEGYVFLSDRRSDMILVGGVNVYPAEIEAAAESHGDVLSAGSVGIDDGELGKKPALVVQTRSGTVPEDLADHLAEALARVKRPVRIVATAEPLRDPAGKVRRRDLLAKFD